MSSPSNDQRPTMDEAIAAWEAKGPTSLTVALMAEALYRARDEFGDQTHGLNHSPLPEGALLAPGFCPGCDLRRAAH